MNKEKVKRPAKQLDSMEQVSLGFENPNESPQSSPATKTVVFREGTPTKLFIGDKRLSTYLEEIGLDFVLKIGQFLQAYDYSVFTKAYNQNGRPAIHPRIMLGLILYGMLTRQWSLRQLESLAMRDVGAWWLCGGLQPDHSTIGKFINLHADTLGETFFVTLTQQLVRKLNLNSQVAAGDGTVIEAVGSHYKVLKAEAARLAAKEAQEEAKKNSEDKEATKKAELLQRAADIATEKQESLRKVGKSTEGVCVLPSEPEATVQPLKNKVMRPSYKPSVLTNQHRLIVGQTVHPTNESIAIAPMLQQHHAIHQALPERLLLDAGYHNVEVLSLCVALNLDVMCPSGSVDKTDTWEKKSNKDQTPKSAFRFDEKKKIYICPENKELVFEDNVIDGYGRKVARYRGVECSSCPVSTHCTKSKNGRMIRRYEGEEVKEAMTEVMKHPQVKLQYRQRKALVEPAFAELKERQELKRFHRKGLPKVKIEFALHCVAYNLKRASRLEAEACLIVFTLYSRKNEDWEILGNFCAIIFNPVAT